MPKEPDAAAVASLAAIVTVLTFLSAFVSVRLHGAYRDALERKRQLDLQLVSRRDAFPVDDLVDDYDSVRRALPETLATPVLAVLVVFTVLGIWLAVLTSRAANLRWFDSRAPDKFYAVALLALALVAVTALVGADYVRLRRRLRSAAADSPVHRIVRAEESIGAVWIDKQRWHNASRVTGWAIIAKVWLAGQRKEWEEKLSDLNKVPVQQRDATWKRGRDAAQDLLASNEELIASWNAEAEKAERRLADLGPGVSTGIGQELRDRLQPAQKILDTLARRPGMENWGHLAGLRAIAGLVDAYVPLYDDFRLEPAVAAQLQGWLRLAIENEPHQQRWYGASALLAEILGDTHTAAQHTIRQWDLGSKIDQPGNFMLEPVESGKPKEWALPSARKPATYRAAYDKERESGDWIACSFLAQNYLSTTLDVAGIDLDKTALPLVLQCIREAAEGMCNENEIGWYWADEFLDRCTKKARQALATSAGFIDLVPDIDRIGQEVVGPRRSAWDAAHSMPKTPA